MASSQGLGGLPFTYGIGAGTGTVIGYGGGQGAYQEIATNYTIVAGTPQASGGYTFGNTTIVGTSLNLTVNIPAGLPIGTRYNFLSLPPSAAGSGGIGFTLLGGEHTQNVASAASATATNASVAAGGYMSCQKVSTTNWIIFNISGSFNGAG